VVFQNNIGNAHSPNIIALPITSSIKKMGQPTHVMLKASDTGLRMDSVVLCENPERMSKQKIGKFITKLSDKYMKKITEANLLATSAISFLDIDSLLKVWRKATTLNVVMA
jgi:mRNA interferase MazF